MSNHTQINDTKIYLVTFTDDDGKVRVSHGIGNNSLENYCLPWEPIEYFKPKRDEEGVYV